MSKPVVYLDVDGVLNAYGYHRGTPPKDCYSDFKVHKIDGYDVILSQQMADEFLEATKGAEILWVTTWEQDAAEMIAPVLGFPEWDYLYLSKGWKLAAVHDNQMEEPRPFVWIDDEESSVTNMDVLGNEIPYNVPRLYVKPNYRTGIKPSEIEIIRDFVQFYV